jgi:hypothetical protein
VVFAIQRRGPIRPAKGTITASVASIEVTSSRYDAVFLRASAARAI